MEKLIKKLRAGCEGYCEECEYSFEDGKGCRIYEIAGTAMEGMLIEIKRLREIVEKQAEMNHKLADMVIGGEDV